MERPGRTRYTRRASNEDDIMDPITFPHSSDCTDCASLDLYGDLFPLPTVAPHGI